MTPARRFDALAALVVLGLAAAIGLVIALGEPRPLAVVDTRPGDGASGVPVTAQVLVVFSRPVDEASVRAGLSVEPQTEGFVSAAGRRAAFTPRAGFRAGAEYTVTLGRGIRDRAGRPLPGPVTVRFRTRGQALVVGTSDGRLLRVTLPAAGPGSAPEGPPAPDAEPLAGPGVGAFATSAAGDLAYVLPAEGVLVVESAGTGATRRIALPKAGGSGFGAYGTATRAVEIRELTWAPGGAVLGFLAPRRDGALVPHLVHLGEATPAATPFGPPPQPLPTDSALVVEALKKSLVEIVYRRDTFAFTPDGRGVIIRDRNWDYAVFGFDESRRGTLGAFLAVGNTSPSGEVVAVVDVDPADPALKRQVIAYERSGRLRALSSPERDSHSPRFAHRSDRLVYVTGEAVGPPGERRFALEVVDLGSGARRRLTAPPPGQSDDAPRWSPDDAWISFRRAPAGAPERGQVWLVLADTRRPPAAERGSGPEEARPLPVAATDAQWVP